MHEDHRRADAPRLPEHVALVQFAQQVRPRQLAAEKLLLQAPEPIDAGVAVLGHAGEGQGRDDHGGAKDIRALDRQQRGRGAVALGDDGHPQGVDILRACVRAA